LLVLGVGGLVAGAVESSQAGSAHDSGVKARNGQSCVGSSTPECGQAHQFALDEQSDKNASTALYVTGGVLVVGAVAAFVLWPKAGTAKSAYVVPSVGKDGAGLNFRTSF
jgi:hypothetical protein